MKKFVLSFLLFLLVGSCGSFIGAIAHAQTMTPSETAALSQSLQGLKEKLLTMQAQAAAQTAAPATPSNAMPAVAATANNNAATIANLEAITGTLSKLTQIIAADPSVLTPSNRLALQSALGGMRSSLLAIDQSLPSNPAETPSEGAIASAAMVTPSVATPAATVTPMPAITGATATAAAPTAISQPSQAAITVVGNTAAASATAQVSSQISLSRGWMVTIGIILLLILGFAIDKWRRGKKENEKAIVQNNKALTTVMPTAQKPADTIIITQSQPSAPSSSVTTPPSSNNQ